jgi:hypothetical protein
MKLIPTKVHGLLDYLTAGTLYALPSWLGWDPTLTKRVRIAALGTLLYSLVTQYEWGLKPLKVLPMRGHLALDAASGTLFCAAPWLVSQEPQGVKNLLVGIGLFELFVTANTQPDPARGGQ